MIKKTRLSNSPIHPKKFYSRNLDFYGIHWEYEHRSFMLDTDENGNVTEAFTPDFYLPEQNPYVELNPW